MSSKRRRTDADYEAAADDYEARPISASEVRSVEIGPALRIGRPAGATEAAGKTPGLTVRFPKPIRAELDNRAAAADVKPSELVRRAVVEYFDNHPV